MFVFYLVATLFFALGAYAFIVSTRIVWWEWIAVSAAGFVMAGAFQACIAASMTSDIETWSGQITEPHYTPSWVEYYEYAVYRTETRTGTRSVTDSKGRSHTESYTYTVEVFDHWQPTTENHGPEWRKNDSFGRSWDINEVEYKLLVFRFGKEATIPGDRSIFMHHASRMLSGDPNDYIGVNTKSWIEPVTKVMSWQNRVKAAPSAFCFQKVPKDAPVFPYPENKDPFTSNRLLGTATSLGVLTWDQMNARLGPNKKVNVIAIGFGDKDRSVADLQRAAWVGGKKNDIVICFGGEANQKPAWARVFGWSDSNACKYDLEQIVLTHPMTGAVVPLIETEIEHGYTIKDWSQFDYLTIEPPPWTYALFVGVLLVVEGVLWVVFFSNDQNKAQPVYATSYASRNRS